jgi:type IV conjugative transfer system coupling protein TraD
MHEEPNHKHFTRGGQIAFHNLRMLFQIKKGLLTISFISWFLTFITSVGFFINKDRLIQFFYYHTATVYQVLGKEHVFTLPHQGVVFKQSVLALTTHPYYRTLSKHCIAIFIQCAWLAMGVSVVMAVLLSWYFVKKGKFQTKNHFVRGSQLAESHVVRRDIIKQGLQSDITIDGFPLITGSEVQHLLVHGTVGKGKSQFIMKIMDRLRARGDRVIVYDKGCTFMESYFHDKTDKLLNPFDARCANWDLWREAPTDAMLENMAESLIPAQGENDPFWVNAARTVFASTAARMRHDSGRSLDKLLSLLVTGAFEELEPYLKGTAAATLVSNKIEKTAISIRAVITTYLKSMQSLQGLNQTSSEAFSIRDYILNPKEKGWLFISSNGEQHKALKPLISMWIAMASMTLLSLPEDANRRIWFICDELPSLHKLPMLGETIAEVRKFGGCFLLGMQSFAQLEKVYGRSSAAEIFDLLNTRAFFASPSSQMAQLVSKELGDEEIDDSRENYSYGANSIRDGISLGKNRVTRPIVTYPEIMSLDSLACYLRLPGHFPITQLKLKYQKRKVLSQGFVVRELPNLLPQTSSSTSSDDSDDASSDMLFLSQKVIPKSRNHQKTPKKDTHLESIF